jgi:hypothetical protein
MILYIYTRYCQVHSIVGPFPVVDALLLIQIPGRRERTTNISTHPMDRASWILPIPGKNVKIQQLLVVLGTSHGG